MNKQRQKDRDGTDAILGRLLLGVSLGTLSRRGHYGLHLPLGIPCVTVKGSVREGCQSLRGSCRGSLSILCHFGFSVSQQKLLSSWGCFCVMLGAGGGGVLCVRRTLSYYRASLNYGVPVSLLGLSSLETLVICGNSLPFWGYM